MAKDFQYISSSTCVLFFTYFYNTGKNRNDNGKNDEKNIVIRVQI